MTKVGGREIVWHQVLLVPESESVDFEVEVGEPDTLKVRMVFAETTSAATTNFVGADPRFVIEYETPDKEGGISLINWEDSNANGLNISRVILTFHNFNTSYGQTLQSPQIVADTANGKEITFLAAVYKFGKVFKVESQFMIGDSL